MHLSDGELRAYIDHQLVEPAFEKARTHLAACAACQARLERLSERAGMVGEQLALLAPSRTYPAGAALNQFKERISKKEVGSMWKKMFSRPYRPAWAVLGVLVILALALSIPSVGAIANSFLGLFRVQQVTVVQVNPGNMPQNLGNSSELESLMSQDVQVQKQGKAQSASSAQDASQLAGISVRLPSAAQDQAALLVQPASHMTFKIEANRIQAILNEIGHSDIKVPAQLDGSTVDVNVPAAVAALYGPCQQELAAAQQQPQGFKPDQAEGPRNSDCTSLVQLASPTVSTPPGLDIKQIGQAFLEVLGMTPEEAAHFSQNIDWATTLVVPIPRNSASYQDVSVDGVNGTFIQEQRYGNHYLLMWVKNGVVYALTGPGDVQAALSLANSLK
jgi:hypothetical protein